MPLSSGVICHSLTRDCSRALHRLVLLVNCFFSSSLSLGLSSSPVMWTVPLSARPTDFCGTKTLLRYVIGSFKSFMCFTLFLMAVEGVLENPSS